MWPHKMSLLDNNLSCTRQMFSLWAWLYLNRGRDQHICPVPLSCVKAGGKMLKLTCFQGHMKMDDVSRSRIILIHLQHFQLLQSPEAAEQSGLICWLLYNIKSLYSWEALNVCVPGKTTPLFFLSCYYRCKGLHRGPPTVQPVPSSLISTWTVAPAVIYQILQLLYKSQLLEVS